MRRRIVTWLLASPVLLALPACEKGKGITVSGAGTSKPSGKPKPLKPSMGHTLPSYVRWKPNSEGDGNLVILLPADHAQVTVRVDGVAGTKSITNGGRPTYRFGRPGGAYSPGVQVKIGSKTYTVANPGQNYG